MHELTPILVIDDNPFDREAVRRGLQRCGLANPCQFAENGLAGLSALREQAGAAAPSRPPMVFLDLSMPVMDGFEFLEVLRADAQLSQTIVFVLTSSADEADIGRCHALGVSGYLTKQAIAQDIGLLGDLLKALDTLAAC